MNTLTVEGHKKLVEILESELGVLIASVEPNPNIVGNYVESAYKFQHWIVEINCRGLIKIKPTTKHPAYAMYQHFRGGAREVAVWLELGSWSDMEVSRTPEHVAERILKFTNKVDAEQ